MQRITLTCRVLKAKLNTRGIQTVPSDASRVITARATQCSFSSVFHLKKAGMDPAQAKEFEDLFSKAVAVPIAFMAGIFWVTQMKK